MAAKAKLQARWVIVLIVAFFAVTYASKRAFVKRQQLSAHPFESAVRVLEASKKKEWCDEQQAAQRLFVAKVIDRYRGNLDELWKKRQPEEFKTEKLVKLGPVFLRPTPPRVEGVEIDRTVWNWVEAYAKLQQTQNGGDDKLWYDVDTSAQYLLRKDAERILKGKKFLPPERTEHRFRPNPAVRRFDSREFRVELDPGDFKGHERELARLIEGEWKAKQLRVKIDWVPRKKDAYRLVVREGGRSLTNHTEKTVGIANYSSLRTVAHEFGHVLGFDDHYYDVWHPEYCYYTQEYRRSDLMSDSSAGQVTARHWELLDQAYPWRRPALKEPFNYVYKPI